MGLQARRALDVGARQRLRDLDGAPRPGAYLDGVSVFVPRLGREVGPSTPVVGRFGDDDFRATSPLAVLRNASRFGLTSWRFEARDGKRRVVGEVDAPRDSLVGVTYHDPDGEQAYCYNSEVASMRLSVWDRTSRGRFGWMLRETLRRRRPRPLRVRPARARRRRGAAGHVSFRAASEHLAIALPGATALFTTRRGGVSEGPYASLNLGLLTDDDPERVRGQPRARARAGRRRSASRRAARCTARASPSTATAARRPTAR